MTNVMFILLRKTLCHEIEVEGSASYSSKGKDTEEVCATISIHQIQHSIDWCINAPNLGTEIQTAS